MIGYSIINGRLKKSVFTNNYFTVVETRRNIMKNLDASLIKEIFHITFSSTFYQYVVIQKQVTSDSIHVIF